MFPFSAVLKPMCCNVPMHRIPYTLFTQLFLDFVFVIFFHDYSILCFLFLTFFFQTNFFTLFSFSFAFNLDNVISFSLSFHAVVSFSHSHLSFSCIKCNCICVRRFRSCCKKNRRECFKICIMCNMRMKRNGEKKCAKCDWTSLTVILQVKGHCGAIVFFLFLLFFCCSLLFSVVFFSFALLFFFFSYFAFVLDFVVKFELLFSCLIYVLLTSSVGSVDCSRRRCRCRHLVWRWDSTRFDFMCGWIFHCECEQCSKVRMMHR